jgi:hypothetical protein
MIYKTFEPEGLHRCTAPVHTLLHIAAMLEMHGPPCYYWCFSIERVGGWMKRSIKSRRHLLVALSNVMIREEQVSYEVSWVNHPSCRRPR